jgi:spore germination protein YaaH
MIVKTHIRVLYIAILILVVALTYGYRDLTSRLEVIQNELIAESMMTEHLYIDGEIYDRGMIVTIDGKDYINYDLAIEAIDETIELSNSGQRIYVKVNPELIDLESSSLNEYLAENIVDINIPIVMEEGQRYISMEIFSRVERFEYGHAGRDYWMITHEKAQEGMMGESPTIYFNTHLNMEKGTIENRTLHVCELADSYFVVGKDMVGYAKKADVFVLESEHSGYSHFQQRDIVAVKKPFYLVWDQINSHQQSLEFNRELSEENADVISPTFLELNINGIVINITELDYIDWAHEQDMAVWALVSNSFNPDWTREMISDPVLVDRFISQMAIYSILYEFDGINVDFENVYLADSSLLNDFIEKLSLVTNEMNLPLSMDVTVPEGSDQWSKVYDRVSLGQSLDYLMVMAYDEYWASSSVSGPVASIPWTIEGLEATLQLVDADKVVLGIPGYMRLWKDYSKSNESSVLSMKNRDQYLADNEYKVVYLEDMGINYTEKRVNGVLHRIWIEDNLSLGKRLDMVDTYRLPGIALWRRGFFDSEAEELIGERLEK